MLIEQKKIRGRGTAENPSNRFEKLHLEPDPELEPEEQISPRTQLFHDLSSSILTHNESPDVGFETSLNPYRGCEHGCIYCFARPTHEYLGFSLGLDFETKIMVKENAPELLRKELSSPKWKPHLVVMSGVTDCYQPIERKLKITRGCLEVFCEFRNPVSIITKNHLVTRDLDLLQELARHNAVSVNVSVTTLDADLARVMEPRTSLPVRRLAAIRELSRAGIPVNVMVAPVVPALTDHEMFSILQHSAEAGAQSAGYVVMRLPYAVKELFEQWLIAHFPEKKEKVLARIRSLRDGKLNDANWGSRMKGQGIFAEQIARNFEVAARKTGLDKNRIELSTAAFKAPGGKQLQFF